MLDIGENRWFIKMPGQSIGLDAFSTIQNLRSLCDRGLHLLLNFFEGVFGDQRADVNLGLLWIADLQLAYVFHESLRELLDDRLHQIDAFGSGANLPGIQQTRPSDARHCHIQIGVLENDERIDAAKFKVYLLQLRSRPRRNLPADIGRTSESDQVHVRMIDQHGARLARAGDDVDDAGRQR